MEEVLENCGRLGITFEPSIRKLAKLQDLSQEAKSRRNYLKGEGDDLTVVDAVIKKVHEEIEVVLSSIAERS